ncbi:FAD-dependent oxidoreductase [Legionella gresilensis]|uniref:FAD-dependent oxidoreductase n=1 Tax=Legionella gresilensis TaxID=91823 RepID=UPI0010413BA8|nr:FAD-binding oxidoreductase [Legionella gresilensis]
MQEKDDSNVIYRRDDGLEVSNDGKFDIIIMGAGIAGTNTALELSKIKIDGREPRIALIEAGPEVLPPTCSTQNECNKLHTGMHYLADLETALKCLENAIEFAKKYPDFIAGKGREDNPCLGRHYITDKSKVSLNKSKRVVRALIKFYKAKIKEDPNNKVFGEPEDFIKRLKREKYNFISNTIPYRDEKGDIVDTTAVARAYQTAEVQVDIPKLQKHLQQEILNSKNITFIPNTYVTNVGLTFNDFGYYVCAENTSLSADQGAKGKKTTPVRFEADQIVNCTWQNAAFLDKGIKPADSRAGSGHDVQGVNRVKVSIEVNLPEGLQHLNTSLFSTGPFVSFTNLGDGRAILTSERHTNIDFYPTGIEMPSHLKERIENLRSIPITDEDKKLAKAILDGGMTINDENRKLAEAIIDGSTPITDEPRKLAKAIIARGIPLTDEVRKLAEAIIARSIPLTDEARTLANAIIDDCSSYFTDEFKSLFQGTKAKDIKIHVGIVNISGLQKEYTSADIHSQDSIIHTRRAVGAQRIARNFARLEASKMTAGVVGARKAVDILVRDRELLLSDKLIVNLIKAKLELTDTYAKKTVKEVNHLLHVEFVQQIREITDLAQYLKSEAAKNRFIESKVENLIKQILTFTGDNKREERQSPRKGRFFSPAEALTASAAKIDKNNSILEQNMVIKKQTESSGHNPNGCDIRP